MIAAGFCLVWAAMPSDVLGADRRPYFKAFGGDVMTGGWFLNGECDDTAASNYQDARNAPDRLSGGILAYALSSPAGGGGLNSGGGASSQFAAFVLGHVDGNSASRFGFYTNSAQGGSVSGRTFANNAAPATPWGGLFQDDQYNGIRQSHCIPDYYSKKPADTDTALLPAAPGAGSFSGATASGVYRASSGAVPFNLTSGAVNLALGSRIIIYVDGDVFIGHNISYSHTAAGATVENVPRFTIIARGSIYIGPGVTQLYGFYIAQPDPANASALTDDEGVIWTCHPNSTGTIFYTWPIDNCNEKLTITGGLVAKQVNLLRIRGDVSTPAAGEDSLAGAEASNNIAEIINYRPDVAMGGPFITNPDPDAQRNAIDSLISLPPVF